MTQVPIARTVKHRGVVVAPRARPWRERIEAAVDALGERPRAFVVAMVGLWPITAVLGAGLGICWLALISPGP